MKKKTFEEVREIFESRGFKLLSTEYINARLPLNYICDNGHQTKMTFDSLHSGSGCVECSGKKKKTIEEVRLAFSQRGYTLLSTEYKSNLLPLNYLCSNGHQTKINFNKLQCGKGCLECSGSKKKTISEVRLAFSHRGYTLLSMEYKSNLLPLDYICDQGHSAQICFNKLQQGRGCAECAGLKKKTIEEVKKLFASRNYMLISNEYKNSQSPLSYICSNGHQTKIRLSDLQNGRGCAGCSEHGFNPSKPATLYYLRFQFEGNFYYKIGITNRIISERFQVEKTPYTIIKETTYTLGKDAYTQEQAILKKFAKYRYKGKPFLTTNGNTELFIKDILYIDSSVLYSC